MKPSNFIYTPLQGLFLVGTFMLSFIIESANAEVLCIRNNNKVIKANVSLGTALKVAETACPAGFRQILNTATLIGPKGEQGATGPTGSTGAQGPTGAPAVGASTCRVRISDAQVILNDANKSSVNSVSQNCLASEYALAIRTRLHRQYSNDFSQTTSGVTSSTLAGQSISDQWETVGSPQVIDSDGYPIGGSANISGDGLGFYDSVTGTSTFRREIGVTCCDRGI